MPGSWSSWALTDQAAIDTCAEELWTASYPNDVHRGHDNASVEQRRITIHDPNDPTKPQFASLGQAVVLMGSLLLVMSLADYEASPFYEAP